MDIMADAVPYCHDGIALSKYLLKGEDRFVAKASPHRRVLEYFPERIPVISGKYCSPFRRGLGIPLYFYFIKSETGVLHNRIVWKRDAPFLLHLVSFVGIWIIVFRRDEIYFRVQVQTLVISVINANFES